ncbi:MAG: DNA-3-methyladenine glycosylase I [Longimicrobiales bacterium]|nr:DNA-3-methyladenine glycosylase I [Longimicrobiales bacterium]
MTPKAEVEPRRCFWVRGAAPDYVAYHDLEWGFPVVDDHRLFEKISLEGFQSGLSWLTILRKRENFRKAFAGFDLAKVARFGPKHVEKLLQDAGIVRHRGKIEATLNNAKRACEMAEEFGSLAAYLWRFEADPATRPEVITEAVLRTMTTSPEAIALSKDLKKRGWRFVGPTTMYAFSQAMGLVNDHEYACATRAKVVAARRRFRYGSTRRTPATGSKSRSWLPAM